MDEIKTISASKAIRGLKIFIALSLLGLLTLFYYSSFSESYTHLRNFKLTYLFIALGLSGIDWLAGGLRLYIFSSAVHKQLRFVSCFKANTSNIFLGGVTPSQTGGGVAQIYVLYKDGMPFSKATVSSLMCFLATIFFLLCCFLYVSFIHRVEIGNAQLMVFSRATISIFGLIILLFSFLVAQPIAFEKFIHKLLGFLPAVKNFSDKKGWLDLFLNFVKESRFIIHFYLKQGKLALLLGVMLTVIIYLNKFLIAYVIIKGMGLDPPFLKVIYIQVLLIVIFYFAPSPGASGLAEVSSAALMGMIIPQDYQAVFVVLWRSFTLYLGMAVGGTIFLKI